MGARDIMPYESTNGTTRVRYFPMKASESFEVGEVVGVDVDGLVNEAADNAADSTVIGIASEGPGASNVNPKTDAVYATNDPIGVWIPNTGDSWITKNFSVSGSVFDDTAPVVANIGDEAGFALIGGNWGLDIAQSENLVRIIDILDETKASIIRTQNTLSTGTTSYIVFVILSGLLQSPTAVVAPDA